MKPHTHLEKIASVLGVSFDWLLLGEEPSAEMLAQVLASVFIEPDIEADSRACSRVSAAKIGEVIMYLTRLEMKENNLSQNEALDLVLKDLNPAFGKLGFAITQKRKK